MTETNETTGSPQEPETQTPAVDASDGLVPERFLAETKSPPPSYLRVDLDRDQTSMILEALSLLPFHRVANLHNGLYSRAIAVFGQGGSHG